LLARIENLERQLQARQYAAQPPAAPAPAPYASYYPPALRRTACTELLRQRYYSSYPSYYPTYYYPVAPAYSYAVYSRPFVGRPAYARRAVGTLMAGSRMAAADTEEGGSRFCTLPRFRRQVEGPSPKSHPVRCPHR